VIEPINHPDGDDEQFEASHWPDDWDGQQRVENVATTLREPRSAEWVADRADVSTPTARKYLDRLVEHGTLERHAGDTAQQAATYAPDPQAQMLDRVRELAQQPGEALTERKASLLAEIDAWREEFDVDSPTALRVSVDSSCDADERRRRRQIAYEWESREYRCSLLDVAIQFRAHLDQYDQSNADADGDPDGVTVVDVDEGDATGIQQPES
jgi:hypothetical protein